MAVECNNVERITDNIMSTSVSGRFIAVAQSDGNRSCFCGSKGVVKNPPTAVDAHGDARQGKRISVLHCMGGCRQCTKRQKKRAMVESPQQPLHHSNCRSWQPSTIHKTKIDQGKVQQTLRQAWPHSHTPGHPSDICHVITKVTGRCYAYRQRRFSKKWARVEIPSFVSRKLYRNCQGKYFYRATMELESQPLGPTHASKMQPMIALSWDNMTARILLLQQDVVSEKTLLTILTCTGNQLHKQRLLHYPTGLGPLDVTSMARHTFDCGKRSSVSEGTAVSKYVSKRPLILSMII